MVDRPCAAADTDESADLIPDLPVWVDWTKWLSQFYYGATRFC